jgi:heme A synthase
MQSYILYLHSILRYFIMLFALIVVVQSLSGILGKRNFGKGNKMFALMLLIFCDLQLLLGFSLYYMAVISTGMLSGGDVMKDPSKRFWAVEHSVGMLIAIILVHIGYTIAKKNIDNERKFKRLFWCIFVALGIFVAMIPWEGKQAVGRPNIPVLHTP